MVKIKRYGISIVSTGISIVSTKSNSYAIGWEIYTNTTPLNNLQNVNCLNRKKKCYDFEIKIPN